MCVCVKGETASRHRQLLDVYLYVTIHHGEVQ
jgi:hypothetical protein